MNAGFNWPMDKDGNPMVLVSAGVGEKIGLPNYSNVTIEPISISKFVPAGKEEEGYAECFLLVEKMLAQERAKVLAELSLAS
jgi:hypothetical protein